MLVAFRCPWLGSGVLAVPYAFGLINYWAVLLLFVVVGLTAFTACLIGDRWE